MQERQSTEHFDKAHRYFKVERNKLLVKTTG
jgi:hypothetical protein